ncbi:hypothetical protein BDZ89DRAFT_1142077 [Hymenopellis radicata]|nr:hypothetical protein BDZ89DRAFT_1142077 [Hymenopellis radicata]
MTLACFVFARTHKQFTGSFYLGISLRRRCPPLHPSTLTAPPDTLTTWRAHRTSNVSLYTFLRPRLATVDAAHARPRDSRTSDCNRTSSEYVFWGAMVVWSVGARAGSRVKSRVIKEIPMERLPRAMNSDELQLDDRDVETSEKFTFTVEVSMALHNIISKIDGFTIFRTLRLPKDEEGSSSWNRVNAFKNS